MIIRSYGLHWKRAWIDWGRRGPGNGGRILGRRADRVRSRTVDFRSQAGIYILQDGFRSVYIGQTGTGEDRLWKRLRFHARGSMAERWDRFSWFGIFPVGANGDLVEIDPEVGVNTTVNAVLNHVEGVLISIVEPPLNRQGPRLGDTQFIQVMASSENRATAIVEQPDELTEEQEPAEIIIPND